MSNNLNSAAGPVQLQPHWHRRFRRQLPVRIPLSNEPGIRPVLQSPRQVPGSLRSGQLEGDAQSDAGLRCALGAVHPLARNCWPHGRLQPRSVGIGHAFHQVSPGAGRACSSLAILGSIRTASPMNTTTSCPGWALPGMSSARQNSIRGGAGMFYDSRINSTLFNIYSTARAVPYRRRLSNARLPHNIDRLRQSLRDCWSRESISAAAASANTVPIIVVQQLADLRPVQGLPGSARLRLEPGRGAATDQQPLLAHRLCGRAKQPRMAGSGTESRPIGGIRKFDPAGMHNDQQLLPAIHYGGQHRRQHQLQLAAGIG